MIRPSTPADKKTDPIGPARRWPIRGDKPNDHAIASLASLLLRLSEADAKKVEVQHAMAID